MSEYIEEGDETVESDNNFSDVSVKRYAKKKGKQRAIDKKNTGVVLMDDEPSNSNYRLTYWLIFGPGSVSSRKIHREYISLLSHDSNCQHHYLYLLSHLRLMLTRKSATYNLVIQQLPLMHYIRTDISLEEILHAHRAGLIPVDPRERSRLTIRRKHLLQDALHKRRGGLSLKRHLCVTFIGEPAVHEGKDQISTTEPIFKN